MLPVNPTFFFAQDTLVRTSSDTASLPSVQHDSVPVLRKSSVVEADDIFRAMEQREKELDSIARVRSYNAYLRSLEPAEPEGFDTAAVPYLHGQDSLVPGQNPLQPFKTEFFSSRDTLKPVFLEQRDSSASQGTMESVSLSRQVDTEFSHNLRPDWLLGIFIISLVLLAWLKLFYNKFFDNTIQSLANYQLSAKLLRDQNIFSRRVAFALNLNFILIGATAVYLVTGFFNIRFLPLKDILSWLVYAGTLSGLLIFRFLISHAVGHVFHKRDEFREYLHQLLMIYKNLGIYLLVIVIGIAYIRDDLRIYFVYLSGLLVVAAFILRLIRGLKIVLNKKDVLIFYLILYLCTLEFLPLLIFYRFFSSSVQAG